jgi:hypothetical protein
VTYTHGYATPPAAIKRAALILAVNDLAGSNISDRATQQTDQNGTFNLAVPGWRDGQWYGLPTSTACSSATASAGRGGLMATQTSTVPAYLDALKALLDARAAAAPSRPDGGRGGLDRAERRPGAGRVHPVLRAGRGSGMGHDRQQAAQRDLRRAGRHLRHAARRGARKAKEVRDRAYAILAELEDAIRVDPSVSGSARQCQLTAAILEQGAEDNGRWAALAISIEVKAELRSS